MIIGITGKIGVGKSTVTKIFKSYGWVVVDADLIGKEVVTHNPIVLKKLAKEFGQDILINKSILRRELLRERAFKSKKSTLALNKIVHPVLMKELYAQLEQYTLNKKNIIVDAALLLDWNLDKDVDAVVLVHTNLKLRIQRMLARGFSKEAVLDSDCKQKSFQQLRKRSNYLIYNSGTETELKEKVDRLISKLKS